MHDQLSATTIKIQEFCEIHFIAQIRVQQNAKSVKHIRVSGKMDGCVRITDRMTVFGGDAINDSRTFWMGDDRILQMRLMILLIFYFP